MSRLVAKGHGSTLCQVVPEKQRRRNDVLADHILVVLCIRAVAESEHAARVAPELDLITLTTLYTDDSRPRAYMLQAQRHFCP